MGHRPRRRQPRPIAALAAGVIVAIPGAVTVFMAQPETFAIDDAAGRRRRSGWPRAGCAATVGRSSLAGLLAGSCALTRNDGILLAGDARAHLAGRPARGALRDASRQLARGAASTTGARSRSSPGSLALGLFLLVIGPWWFRQLAVFGSISPTTSSGAALWIREFREWNSIIAEPSLATFLGPGPGPDPRQPARGAHSALASSRCSSAASSSCRSCSLGRRWRRAATRAFQPWFAYTFVVFAGATLLYPRPRPRRDVHPHRDRAGAARGDPVDRGRRSRSSGLDLGRGAASLERAERAGGVFLWGSSRSWWRRRWSSARPVMPAGMRSAQPRIALAAYLDAQAVPSDDRLLSIDAGGHQVLDRPRRAS